MKPQSIAPHLHQISLGFVNAYAITTPEGNWVLVDSGLKLSFSKLQNLDEHFGKAPLAIVLTHGHLDHAGSARELAQKWNVRIYAHHFEKPFLTGQSIYPPPDPTVGGALAQMSRLMPWEMINLTGQLETFPADGLLPFLPGWKLLETPGHSPGHTALWHEDDRVLVAGDTLCTADFDSLLGATTHKPQQLARPGSPFTCDWNAAKTSVGKLADLEPVVIAAGHGEPMSGAQTPERLRDFFRAFHAPEQGRYVAAPATWGENGITSLPPAPRDDFKRNLGVFVGAAGALALGAKLKARRK